MHHLVLAEGMNGGITIVSLATALAVIIGPIVTAFLQQRSARLAREDAQRAEVAAHKAALAAEDVKRDLKVTNVVSERQLRDIRETGDKVHTLVNNSMSLILKRVALLTDRIATQSGDPADRRAAEMAAQASQEHEIKQDKVNEATEQN